MSSVPENLWLAEQWQLYRERIQRLLGLRMPAVLQRRISVDDLLQETYLACGRRLDFLQSEPEVPLYVKLRRIAMQTLTDMERHHLAAAKRDAMKEQSPEDDVAVADAWAQFADTISSPRTHLERLERQAMARSSPPVTARFWNSVILKNWAMPSVLPCWALSPRQPVFATCVH